MRQLRNERLKLSVSNESEVVEDKETEGCEEETNNEENVENDTVESDDDRQEKSRLIA